MGRTESGYLMEQYTLRDHTDDMAAKEYDSACEHPTIEQLFMREAIKHLTPKQKVIWDYHNFDKLTLQAIGKKVGISHQAVARHIEAAKTKIKKWMRMNKVVYELLKSQQKDS